MIENPGINDDPFMDFLIGLSPKESVDVPNDIITKTVLGSFTATHLSKKATNNGREFEIIGLPVNKEDAENYDPDSIIYQSANAIIATKQALEDAKKATFLDENNEPTLDFDAFTANHKIYTLTRDQFQEFQKIHVFALKILNPLDEDKSKETKSPLHDKTDLQNWVKESIKIQHSNRSNEIIFNSFFANKVTDETNSKASRKQEIEQSKLNEKDTKNKIQLEDKEKSREIKNNNVKSNDEIDEIRKKDLGVKGPPKNKIIESMSEQEKFDEDEGPSPNA